MEQVSASRTQHITPSEIDIQQGLNGALFFFFILFILFIFEDDIR